MDKVSLQDLTEARWRSRWVPAPYTARIKPENFVELEQNLAEVRKTSGKGYGQEEPGLHVLLLKASGNPLLIKIAEAFRSDG